MKRARKGVMYARLLFSVIDMTTRSRLAAILLIFGSTVCAQTEVKDATTARLAITGDLPNPSTLTREDLATYPHRTVSVEERDGTQASYEGVPLFEILKKAGAPSGGQLKGKALASYVLAGGRDGYQVTFSLAELDPAIGNSNVLVTDKRDGKPLAATVGPLRLISASDKKPARSVRMLDSLQVVMLRTDGNVQH